MAFLNSVHSQLQSRSAGTALRDEISVPRNPADIRIVRNRMYYAKAAINSKGQVFLGLRHIRKFIDSKKDVADQCRCAQSFPRRK